MRILNIPLFAAFFFLYAAPLFSQNTPTSLYQTDFKKDFISWLWQARFRTDINIGKKSQLSFNNQFSSKLFRQSAEDKWRDDNNLTIHWRYPFNNLFGTQSIVESQILADENTGRKFNKHLIAQEITYRPHSRIEIQPAFGGALEEAFDIQDQGWYARAGVKISKLDMGGYLNYTDLKSVIRAFPGRKNQEHAFFTGWNTAFSKFATDSLRVGYQQLDNRYHISNGLEAVLINARFIFNQLQYRISDNAFLAVLTNFKNRSIDQRTPTPLPDAPDSIRTNLRKEFSLENQVQHVVTKKSYRLQSGMLFSQINNDNPGFDTDINTLQTAFNTALYIFPSSKGRIWGRFSFSKFEYNTPNISSGGGSVIALTDRDDRDEQRFIIDTGYRHRFSPYFSAALKANVYLFHQIYIRSGRSQNNHWNRIYQMSAFFNHQPTSRITHGQELKILANYTVFDFENLLGAVRSFIFRKFIYTDSLTIRLTDKLSLNNIYRLEREDNGTFFQEAFSQLVTKELTAHFFNINLERSQFFGLKVTGGVSFFFRDEWQFTPDRERKKVRRFRSVTPRITAVYPAGNRLLLFLTYGTNRSRNGFRTVNADVFSETEQFFSSGNINLRYAF